MIRWSDRAEPMIWQIVPSRVQDFVVPRAGRLRFRDGRHHYSALYWGVVELRISENSTGSLETLKTSDAHSEYSFV